MWNLNHFYKSIDDPQIEEDKKILAEKTKIFVEKWQNRTDYLEDPVILKEALDDYEKYCRYFSGGGNIYYYLRLSSVLDQLDPKLKAKLNQISNFALDLQNQIQFFELSLAKTKITNIEGYEHFLEKIVEMAPHLLSDNEEKILNLKSLPAYEFWVDMTEKFLSKETWKGKNFSQILSDLSSTNKKTRDSSAIAFNNILEKYSDVAEHELNAILQDKKINDELRKFDRPDSARHISDDVSNEIVDILVKTVTENFKISQDFYTLKAKLLGVKKLKYHERNVPIGKTEKEYTLEETKEAVSEVFKKLDNEFYEIYQNFEDNKQIDYLPKKGKMSGAACWHNLITQPTYLFLNFTGKLRDITTLAHELGHGINNELVKKSQNSINFGTPLSTAEVASTFMEDFVFDKLMFEADKKQRLALIMEKLNDDVSTIFRQVALYNFEKELHNTFRSKGYLPKEEIGEIFTKHMKAYMGPSVEQSKGSRNWWIYWSHIRSYFYVYSYASGLLISKSLQHQVRKDPQQIIKVKEFLSAGHSASPKNIFLKLGIDITDQKFWEAGIEEVKNLLESAKNL